MEKMVKRILAKLMTVTLISSISFTSLTVNVSTLNAGSVFEQSAANGIISDDIIKENQEKDLTSEDEKYGEETGNGEMLEGEDQEDFSSENGNFKEEVGNEEISEDENQEGSLSEDRNTEEEPFKEGDQMS